MRRRNKTAQKVWYKIYVGEITKNEHGENTLVDGAMQLVAQVRSKGLAYIIYQKLLDIYPAHKFIVKLE
jgi:hypothetical protein